MGKKSKAYTEGYSAYEVQDDRDSNPYDVDTPESKEWYAGWDDAETDDDQFEEDDDDNEDGE